MHLLLCPTAGHSPERTHQRDPEQQVESVPDRKTRPYLAPGPEKSVPVCSTLTHSPL